MGLDVLEQLITNGFAAGCNLAIMAVGLSLIYNTTRVLHVAHGATYTLAAYICYTALSLLHWPLWLAILMALLAATMLGLLMEIVVYAPLARRRASTLVALIASLGMYIVIVNIIAVIPAFGSESKILLSEVQSTYRIGQLILTRLQLVQVLCAALVLPAFLIALRFTSLGRVIRGVRDNPALAQSLGVSLYRVRIIVFAAGSLLAGVSSVLSALDIGMDPHMGMSVVLEAAVAMIVGGVGTFEGAVLGAMVLTNVQSVVIWQLSARWTGAVAYLLLILALIFRPLGILGTKRRMEEAQL